MSKDATAVAKEHTQKLSTELIWNLKGTLDSIIRQSGFSKKQFYEALKRKI